MSLEKLKEYFPSKIGVIDGKIEYIGATGDIELVTSPPAYDCQVVLKLIVSDNQKDIKDLALSSAMRDKDDMMMVLEGLYTKRSEQSNADLLNTILEEAVNLNHPEGKVSMIEFAFPRLDLPVYARHYVKKRPSEEEIYYAGVLEQMLEKNDGTIIFFTKKGCGFCTAPRLDLKNYEHPYVEVDLANVSSSFKKGLEHFLHNQGLKDSGIPVVIRNKTIEAGHKAARGLLKFLRELYEN